MHGYKWLGLQLEDGVRIKVKPSCVLEDITDGCDDGDGAVDNPPVVGVQAPCDGVAPAAAAPAAAGGDGSAAGQRPRPGDAGYNHLTGACPINRPLLTMHD